MKRKIQQGIVAMLIGVGLLATASAEVYKWTDEQGRVHYGDSPPDQQGQPIEIQPDRQGSDANPPSDTQRRDKTRRLLRAFDEERRIKQQQEQQQQAQAAQRKRYCAQARDRLKQYQRAGALYRLDTEGERQYLEQGARQQAEARTRQDIKKWCN